MKLTKGGRSTQHFLTRGPDFYVKDLPGFEGKKVLLEPHLMKVGSTWGPTVKCATRAFGSGVHFAITSHDFKSNQLVIRNVAYWQGLLMLSYFCGGRSTPCGFLLHICPLVQSVDKPSEVDARVEAQYAFYI